MKEGIGGLSALALQAVLKLTAEAGRGRPTLGASPAPAQATPVGSEPLGAASLGLTLVRCYSRHGAEYTDRLPRIVEAFTKLPTRAAILDGELCLIDPRGSPHFYRLMAQMRTSHPDESQLMFLAFDLLHQDGVDLRGLPLTERKRDLRRLCRKSRVPFMREVQTFPNGPLLFDHCSKFGFEGVVSKRLASRYSGGPSRNWVKSKCPGWKRINSERYRLFEGPPRKPELTEAPKTLAKKRRSSQGYRTPPITVG